MGWLLLAQALHAVTFAAHHTVCMRLLAQHFGGALRARGQALYSVVGYGLTGVVGGAGGGLLSEWLGLEAVFGVAAASAALAGACAWKLARCEARSGRRGE